MKKFVSIEDLAADMANLHCRKPADAYPLLCRLLTWVARQTREQTIHDLRRAAAEAVMQMQSEHRAAVVNDLMTNTFEARN